MTAKKRRMGAQRGDSGGIKPNKSFLFANSKMDPTCAAEG